MDLYPQESDTAMGMVTDIINTEKEVGMQNVMESTAVIVHTESN